MINEVFNWLGQNLLGVLVVCGLMYGGYMIYRFWVNKEKGTRNEVREAKLINKYNNNNSNNDDENGNSNDDENGNSNNDKEVLIK